eukprot:5765287-Pyramimonas_sp.AAC.1
MVALWKAWHSHAKKQWASWGPRVGFLMDGFSPVQDAILVLGGFLSFFSQEYPIAVFVGLGLRPAGQKEVLDAS